ncbi:hypothetical protein [Zobellia roscoffensis]|uniref:hypothetical protein n=1 Tax=Zobellia roscoffensis TaxID=2779508 RepID=UPI00188D1ABC|nr:hypothetical protein [Zobellia roscoffensis]
MMSQWKTDSGDNKFDGQYKSCYVIGKGGSFPFNKPTLVISRFGERSPNIYLTNIGYTGCSRNTVRVVFNDDESVLICDNPAPDLNKDSLFIRYFDNTSTVDFIEMLMNKKSVYIRVVNSCGKSDYEFSLKGSSKAISFALGDYLSD